MIYAKIYFTRYPTHAAREIYLYAYLTLYNEERRLGDQRGSDTLVVPFVTSNDGLSIAFLTRYAKYPQPANIILA